MFSCCPTLSLSRLCLCLSVCLASSSDNQAKWLFALGFHFMQVEEEAERPRESAMDTREDSPAEKAGDNLQRQKQLALLASGWSMELVRKRAVQEARDTFVIPAW
uniref:Secreted protein n=1 Tax=Chloropicon primus TaxID=1764295 RepID=A0A7S2WXA3_9CHLO|mmetsp:Transcript_12821/g.35876  ORF Transcript_12821/g.35876 Transcript_12821/m.35876 type:complete len:105 (+) Transcript_12821:307-621(+)